MKLISFSAIKGGVGKTTMALLFAQYLDSEGQKVLLMDKDHQCNLSHYYDVYEDTGTVANIYTGQGDVAVANVAPNIDLIPGSMHLDKAERLLETDPNQNMKLYDWLDEHYEALNLEQYDFIILDCRPDFGIVTRNAIAVSHAIISPIIPNEFSKEAKDNLEIRMANYRKTEIVRPSKESLITAKLFFLANKIAHNTKASKELLEELKTDESVIGQIAQKELFNRSTKDETIIDMANNPEYGNHRAFFEETFETLSQVIKQISNL